MSSLRVVCAIVFLSVAAPAAGAPVFMGLGGVVPDGASRANGISGDGRWVVGTAIGPSGDVAFRWSAATGLQPLGAGTANGVSDDGAVVVGGSDFGSGPEAYRWTEAGGMARLGDLPGGIFASVANAVSADGSVVVGTGETGRQEFHDPPGAVLTALSEAFRWTEAGGMVSIGIPEPAEGGEWFTSGAGVSADGTVIGGSTGAPVEGNFFGWSEAGGFDVSPFAPEGADLFGFGVSPDGGWILGGTTDASDAGTSFVWNPATGEVTGFDLNPGSDIPGSAPLDASRDAERIVGFVVGEAGGPQIAAFHERGAPHSRYLQELLAELGLDVAGWQLESATAISYDGDTIAGYGINPDGVREAWVATIPEPATGVLVALGVALLAVKRRREGV
jgi:probable HAF family extracellular repeat protein